ncbi:SGNH/GDSL hydrolase family protein [Cellulosilyticum ruminicola]|uniref:SGNH/GDSL hydrolase family protein n=1 Tax=Cellulosilyticum ruminicola TaxID=425254 RepID=UPI0006CFB0CD|nr:SGNH/GDSL hydrolase family protein [Cellulosilyticum ruminicola]
MKKNLFLKRSLAFALLSTTLNITTFAAATSNPTIISPQDNSIHYMGRIDTSNAKDFVDLWWPGSTIEADFTGTSIKLNVEGTDPDAPNYLNVYIDGTLTVLKCEYGPHTYTLATNLKNTKHHLLINKRTEVWAPVRFTGFELDPQASLTPYEDKRQLKIEFYGDSITAGVCNEAPTDIDNYEDYIHFNNENAFAPLLAKKLDAQYSCIALGGIGIVNGYLPIDMNDVWDWTNLDEPMPIWDFSKWQADYVVINLGQNDYSSTLSDTFTTEYVTLISKIRSKYPKAHIFCTIGPMTASHDATFVKRIEDAVHMVNTYGDSKVYFHALSQDAGVLHPRVDVNRAMADELADFITKTLKIL